MIHLPCRRAPCQKLGCRPPFMNEAEECKSELDGIFDTSKMQRKAEMVLTIQNDCGRLPSGRMRVRRRSAQLSVGTLGFPHWTMHSRRRMSIKAGGAFKRFRRDRSRVSKASRNAPCPKRGCGCAAFQKISGLLKCTCTCRVGSNSITILELGAPDTTTSTTACRASNQSWGSVITTTLSKWSDLDLAALAAVVLEKSPREGDAGRGAAALATAV